MASDAGGPRTTSYAPAGVDAASAVEVEITDPIDGGHRVRLPLRGHERARPRGRQGLRRLRVQPHERSLQDRRLQPHRTPRAGNGMNFGPRPETSSVQTDNYQRGFTDRWYDNELRITRGAATGVDILDRHDDQFDAADASCVRDPGHVPHRRGRLHRQQGRARCARSATSWAPTPARTSSASTSSTTSLEVINTFLRVHPIPGVVDFFDYSAGRSRAHLRERRDDAGRRRLRHAAGRRDDRRPARRRQRAPAPRCCPASSRSTAPRAG